VFSNTHNEEGYYQVPAFQRGSEPTLHEINNFLLECFTCPNSFQAQARQAQNVSAWLLRYHGDFDNVRLHRTSGAYHGVDLHGYFGNSEDVTGLVASVHQLQLTQTMQHALGAFARDPDAGLNRELGWPTHSSASRSLIILGSDNSPDVRFIKPQVHDSFCSKVTMAGLVLES
jgi:cholinesterase